jgi:hypothetical protein
MQKPILFLVIVGALLAAGVFLSFYGAHLTTQDLTVKEENILPGDSLEISTELDPSKSSNGVFVIQILEDKENTLTAKISDPLGFEILSLPIDRESFEDRFEISSKGTYQLVVENSGLEELQVVGVIGHMPDNTTIYVGITGFYLLIIGLIGIVVVGIYAVRNRNK